MNLLRSQQFQVKKSAIAARRLNEPGLRGCSESEGAPLVQAPAQLLANGWPCASIQIPAAPKMGRFAWRPIPAGRGISPPEVPS